MIVITKTARTRDGIYVPVTVKIDEHAIAQNIADIAARNRSGKSQILKGAVKAKVTA